MLRGILGGFARGRRQTSAATLYLDFLAGLNDSRITYSGGASGTRVNSAGVIVAATTPRFDYDPVTLAAKGLLVEEARTNLMTYSQEFDNAAWTKISASISANATTSPDGTANADKLVEDLDVAQVHLVTEVTTIVSGSVYTASFFVKAAERTKGRVAFLVGGAGGVFADFDFSNGTVLTAATAFGGGTAVGQSIQSFGNGWYRATVTGSGPAGVSAEARFELLDAAGARSYNGNGTSGVFLYGGDLEAGSFPTSYIPTTSASVTRTADSAVMTGTNFSSWYNPTESTFVTAFDIPYAVPSTSGPRVLCTADSVSEANNGQLIFSPGVTGKICAINSFSGGANAGRLDAVEANTPNVTIKAAAAFALNDRALSVNGVTPVTSGAGALPVGVDRLYIGGGATAATYLNGHIRTIQYFPRRVANEQLQALTES